MSITVQLKQLHPSAILPTYSTASSAGMDLAACIPETITLQPGAVSVLIPTGISAYVGDPSYVSFILPRSGMGHKKGLVLGNGTGVIDADYQGELMISACVRPGHQAVTINPGERIAQLVFLPVARVEWEHVSDFHEVTERGTGGFGSTG
jgi:dUTP pyrophosphatase